MGLTRPRAHQFLDLDYKQSVRAVQTSNIASLSGGSPSTVDSVSISVNDRILVTAQTTTSQNGIYIVSIVGAGSNGTWVRASDANESIEVTAGMTIMVTEGSTYADTQWKLTTNNPITLGTTALVFTQTTGIVLSGSDITTALGYTPWHSGNDGSGSGLDADLLDGNNSATAATANTIALRDSSGNLTATVFSGTATSARYADLAEKYLADANYEPGTVVMVGGTQEVTASQPGFRALGAVSTNPAYMMNSNLENGTYIALKGRVPVKVYGPVNKGDQLTTGKEGTAIVWGQNSTNAFAIALETNTNTDIKLVECVIL